MPGKSASRCTIADVAQAAGVSITTVSRVVNDSPLVNQQTVEKVRNAICQLGYAPETAARNLASRRTNTLGVLLPVIGTDFYGLVVQGVEEAAYKTGYDLLIATYRGGNNGSMNSSPTLGPHNTDGMLVANVPLGDTLLDLHLEGFPIVYLYATPPNLVEIPAVTIENRESSYQLVSHLIEVHAYPSIGFLRGPEGSQDSESRELGYRQAMKDHNLHVEEDWIARGNFESTWGRQVILDWHHDNRIPRAIYAGDDDAALGVMLAISEIGLRVPQDVAIVGFDDSTLARYLTPPLTTVRAPTMEVGRRGVQQLVQLIEKGKAEPLSILSTEVVIRKSCGC
jgi:LacI family transcriptional regulator